MGKPSHWGAVILEERAALGITVINGKVYMANAKGVSVPWELVKPSDKLQDETWTRSTHCSSKNTARSTAGQKATGLITSLTA